MTATARNPREQHCNSDAKSLTSLAQGEKYNNEQLDPAVRGGIFVGYRSHTGGKWTEQYKVIDFEAYSKIQAGTGSLAYVHSVSEIYVPGSAGDDQEKHPTFPVADGRLDETAASNDEEPSEELINPLEDLQTDLGETFLSSERAGNHEDLDPNNAGGVGSRETDVEDGEPAGRDPNQDRCSSRAFTSSVGTPSHGPLSFLPWMPPTTYRR